MAAEHVLVLSAADEAPRVDMFLHRLAARGLAVVAGPTLPGTPSHSAVSGAAAAVVVLGRSELLSPLGYPIDNFARAGMLVVVRLDADSNVPPSVAGVHYVDLSAWPDGGPPEFERLVGTLQALLTSGLSLPLGSSLGQGWSIDRARAGVVELNQLTAEVSQLVEILADDTEHTKQLRETLGEVNATYRVVKNAVECFVSLGLQPGELNGAGYAKLGHGLLAQSIRNGRGHCGRIGTRWEKVGGLRDGIKDRVSPELLIDLNQTFERLANADGDVFSAMEELGRALTDEARLIVRHLQAGQEDLARRQIILASKLLQPLENDLEDALAAFQTIETALGYAEPTVVDREDKTVVTQNINVFGNMVGSSIVAAGTIENSSIMVGSAPISDELKSLLADLHAATAVLTTNLPDDEAERAAEDLKELTKEATSPTPRPAFWRRATEGLLTASKKVTDAGLPVIELVTKIVALL